MGGPHTGTYIQSIITPPVNIAASITYRCRALRALCHYQQDTQSACGSCVNICVSVKDCVRSIDCLLGSVCVCLRGANQPCEAHIWRPAFLGSPWLKELAKYRGGKKLCRFEGGDYFTPSVSGDKKIPFCSVYRAKCPSRQNEFHMKMWICVLDPELKKRHFAKAHDNNWKKPSELCFQDGIHYTWMRVCLQKSCLLRLLEYLQRVKEEQIQHYAVVFFKTFLSFP